MTWIDYFMKKLTDWTFRQRPELVVMMLACAMMGFAIVFLSRKIDRIETDFEIKLAANNREWKAALDLSRIETRECEAKRLELAVEFANFKAGLKPAKR